jgi:hypothetical protein
MPNSPLIWAWQSTELLMTVIRLLLILPNLL